MQRSCVFCGASFAGPPQARFCSDAHRKAFARTRTSGNEEPGQVPSEPGQGEVGQGNSDRLPTRLLEIPESWFEPSYVKKHFGLVDFSRVSLDEHVSLVDFPPELLVRLARAGKLQPLNRVCFPVQRPGDLSPRPEALRRLGRTTGQSAG